MRSNRYSTPLVLAAMLTFAAVSFALAGDYEQRFVRNYPPGYYGMWYNAERFSEKKAADTKTVMERYRWDRFMTRVSGVAYPFYPVPFEWDYGMGRTFGLPDYNKNDWP